MLANAACRFLNAYICKSSVKLLEIYAYQAFCDLKTPFHFYFIYLPIKIFITKKIHNEIEKNLQLFKVWFI